MQKLYVLYDASCGFCVRCRWWLSRQRQLIQLEFIRAGSPQIPAMFPEIQLFDQLDDLIVVSDDGRLYYGPPAYIMCLYALAEYREWSLRLASPTLRPFARTAFEALGRKRKALSRLLGLGGEQQLADALAHQASDDCPTCATPAMRVAR